MPLTIVSLRLILNQSSENVAPGIGSSTMPTLVCSDSSGLRLALPPNSTPNCASQSTPTAPVTGQRSGSLVGCVTPVNFGANS